MLGKLKCKMLKESRQRIADENDIPYVTRECRFQGECRGTCPKCESELRYLEQQLAARQAMGKRVTVAALCAGFAFSSAGCTRVADTVRDISRGNDLTGAVAAIDDPEPAETPNPEDWQIMGEVPYDGGDLELDGDVAYPDFGELEGEPVETIDEAGADG